MNAETLDLVELSKYLHRDARELAKWASQGRLPGRRIAGDWRFNRTEVHHWLESTLPEWSMEDLEKVEIGAGGGPKMHDATCRLVRPLMSIETTAVPLAGRTARKVLDRLVEVANGDWQVYMPDEILAAVRARELTGSTSLPGGVAVPHPGRPIPGALGRSIVALGRTNTSLPFDLGKSGHGGMTDLFFLILCQTQEEHLQVLARLSRLFQHPGFLSDLRDAEDATRMLNTVAAAEDAIAL